MRRAAGFTLLELLVALALFAVLAAMAYGGLASMVRTREQLGARGERLAAMQLAVSLLERDLRQAALRPVRGRSGEILPTLIGQTRGFEISTMNAVSPLVVARPTVVRVGYALDGRRLQRLAFAVLDRSPATQPASKTLLEAVDDLGLRYLNADQAWIDQWPPPRPGGPDMEALPRAVELTLRSADFGTIRRVIALPDPIMPPNAPRGPTGPATPVPPP
jgi:general secretion pathway protein J